MNMKTDKRPQDVVLLAEDYLSTNGVVPPDGWPAYWLAPAVRSATLLVRDKNIVPGLLLEDGTAVALSWAQAATLEVALAGWREAFRPQRAPEQPAPASHPMPAE